MRARGPDLEVSVRLRADDAEELLRICLNQLETPVGPTRWVWWRLAQACMAALPPQKGGNHAVVDRHAH